MKAVPFRQRLLAATVTVAASVVVSSLAFAEQRPSLNLYGTTGLIDMPTGESQPDGALTTTTSHFGPISRSTLTFQISPRLSGSFRFLGIRDWNRNLPCFPACTGTDQFTTYYDRSFDLKYQLLDESRYLPSVAIGLQDFVGTGVLAGEYIVATKHVTPDIKVTGGLGWGRLGSYGSIGSPFGVRPPLVAGSGGNFNFDQWFRGPAAPFGGIEWALNENWTVKAEYSSDAYSDEAGYRQTFKRKSPYNFGIEYQRGESFRFGGYYMYGSEVGVAAHFLLNPKARPGGNLAVSAPTPIRPRPSRSADPEAWSTDWVAQNDAGQILRANLAKRLKDDGIEVRSISFDGRAAEVRIINTKTDAEAQIIGRTARAMARVMPASVEQFEIVPVVNGMPVSKVVVQRSDLEKYEFDVNGSEEMFARTQIVSVGAAQNVAALDTESYPKFKWALSPYARLRLFDQNSPFKIGAGLQLTGRLEVTPGLILTGKISKLVASNLDDRPPIPARTLQPVRSANYFYDSMGDPAIETLAVTYYQKLAPELYGRISAGYLERMFGGVSTEVLWMPTNRRWAIGAEVNYVAQRSPDQRFGFNLPSVMYQTDAPGVETGPGSYKVLTGHISGYYAFDRGYHAQLDVGRYLAGDVGATLALKREFENGWKVGAFITKTNVPAAAFGSGSFDKGITLEVPFSVLLGKETREVRSTLIRPFGRDGGQRLEVDGRLYETVRGYRADGLSEQWGRFWK